MKLVKINELFRKIEDTEHKQDDKEKRSVAEEIGLDLQPFMGSPTNVIWAGGTPKPNKVPLARFATHNY